MNGNHEYKLMLKPQHFKRQYTYFDAKLWVWVTPSRVDRLKIKGNIALVINFQFHSFTPLPKRRTCLGPPNVSNT